MTERFSPGEEKGCFFYLRLLADASFRSELKQEKVELEKTQAEVSKAIRWLAIRTSCSLPVGGRPFRLSIHVFDLVLEKEKEVVLEFWNGNGVIILPCSGSATYENVQVILNKDTTRINSVQFEEIERV